MLPLVLWQELALTALISFVAVTVLESISLKMVLPFVLPVLSHDKSRLHFITKETLQTNLISTLFCRCDLFHVSGITPVLSENARDITFAALKSAKEHGVCISFDLNYRAKLWTEDVEEKQAMLREMIKYADICFGNARDALQNV